MNGLPGIEALFREHKRLAYKLTKDELKAIQNYIEGRVLQEQNDILFKTNFMQSEYESNIRQMRQKVSDLEQELEFKSQLVTQYRDSDNNLATVHKQREERLEHKQSQLLLDLGQNQDVIRELNVQIGNLRTDLNEKQKIIAEQSVKVDALERSLKRYDGFDDLADRYEQLKHEVLKVKLEFDNKDRTISKLQQEKQNMRKEMTSLEKRVLEAEKKTESLRIELERQKNLYSSKHEQLLRLQLQLDHERRKSVDKPIEQNGKPECQNGAITNGLVDHRRVKFQNGYFTDTPRKTVQNDVNGNKTAQEKRHENNEELIRERNEILRKELLFLESRVKLLEEKISLYRNQSREMNEESFEISENANKASQLYDKIYVHGTTIIETLLHELQESLKGRKSKLETSITDLLKQAPSIVSRDVCDIRADTLSLKKQAEEAKVNDVFVRTSRLLSRLEVCEKTKFSAKIFSDCKYQNLKKSATKVDDLRDKEKVFTVRKPPTIPLISRNKQQNGNAQNTWKRKHSVSMESGFCLSPTLIDLSLASPVSSPTPRDSRSKTFFGLQGPLPHNEKGIERKSFSEPNFQIDY